MTTRAQLLAVAETYLDIPFRPNGRSRRGLDCIGVPLQLARELKPEGWKIFFADDESHAYPRVRPPGFLRAKLDSFITRGALVHVDVNELQPADLVLRWVRFGHDHHVSLLFDEGTVIEATNTPEPRFKHGRVRKVPFTEGQRRVSFLTGYQFRGIT